MIDVLRRAGAYGQAKKHYPADDPRVIDERRDLVAARLIEHIK
jgi:hypothetical protein